MARQERGRRLLDKIEEGDIDGVTRDLSYDVDLTVDKKGDTPIHLAARKGFLEILELLIRKGGDVNIKNQNGFAAMHYAAREGNLDVVRFLLKNGADPNVKNLDGDAPLHNLVKFQPMDVIEDLISLGMKVNLKNKIGQTPLHIATTNNRLEAIETLMSRGADPNIRDKNKHTAAEVCRDPSIVKQIHLHGVMMEAMGKGTVQSQGISIHKNAAKERIYLKRVNVTIESIKVPRDISATFYCRREMSENSTFEFSLEKGDEMLSDVYHMRVGNTPGKCQITVTVPIYAAPSDKEDLIIRFNTSKTMTTENVKFVEKITFCTFQMDLIPDCTCTFAFFSRARLEENHVGSDGCIITSQKDTAFKLEIPPGTFEEDTRISLQVLETKPDKTQNEKERDNNNSVLLTDIYKFTSTGSEAKKVMKFTIPLHMKIKTVDNVVLLTADETQMRDENCLEVVNAVPQLVNSSLVYEIPHFSIYVVTPKEDVNASRTSVYERIMCSSERRKSGVFFIVIRVEEENKCPIVVVECCIADKAKARIQKWKEKGYKSQDPETSGTFMLAPYQEFEVRFKGSVPEGEGTGRKVAFLPRRASFQPYRVPFKENNTEDMIEGNVLLNCPEENKSDASNVQTLAILPFEVNLVKHIKKEPVKEKPEEKKSDASNVQTLAILPSEVNLVKHIKKEPVKEKPEPKAFLMPRYL